jgi:CelD/BcsL family acetyltransferase involved in cellulose biosynthesis
VRYGPGAAHLMEIMARAIERGCTIFDFTIGDEPYKRDWCEERQALYDVGALAQRKRGRSHPFAGDAGKARDQGKSGAVGRVFQVAFSSGSGEVASGAARLSACAVSAGSPR